MVEGGARCSQGHPKRQGFCVTPWTDAEITRFTKRVALFGRRGIAPAKAEAMADHCALRDQEKDDRRFCVECEHLQQSGHCFAAKQGWLPTASYRMEPVKDVLTRCSQFIWQKA
jgi:hypothetical protein